MKELRPFQTSMMNVFFHLQALPVTLNSVLKRIWLILKVEVHVQTLNITNIRLQKWK